MGISEGKHLAASGNAPPSAANASHSNPCPPQSLTYATTTNCTHALYCSPWPSMHHLDPHERPPDGIRNVYKKYQKMRLDDLNRDQDIIDLSGENASGAVNNHKIHLVKEYSAKELDPIFRAFAGQDVSLQDMDIPVSVPVFEHSDLPGRKPEFYISSQPRCQVNIFFLSTYFL